MATIVAFRAKWEQVTPAKAAMHIADGYGGDWQRWARGHGLSADEVREVVKSLTVQGGGRDAA